MNWFKKIFIIPEGGLYKFWPTLAWQDVTYFYFRYPPIPSWRKRHYIAFFIPYWIIRQNYSPWYFNGTKEWGVRVLAIQLCPYFEVRI